MSERFSDNASMKQHAKLIDDLGGGTEVALAIWGEEGDTKKRRETVYKWAQNGIPWRWRTTVAAIARKRRKPLPSDFFVPGHLAAGSSDPVRKTRATV